MSKRKAAPDRQPFILCDDVISLIVNFFLGKPTVEYVHGKQKEDDMTILATYFSLPLVNKAFNRVISNQNVAWKSMLGKKYTKNEAITQEIARVFVYHEIERKRLNDFIDEIVLKEGVTYRSPVKKRLSQGVLSHKKLRRANYPSTAVKNKVLNALRRYEKICRISCSMRKKYLKMDYYM
jgi:hypothetical protein